MTRRYEGPERAPWPWWRRWACRCARGGYLLLVHPWLTKYEDGTVGGSMTRWAVAVFTYAEVQRMLRLDGPLGAWEALAIFCILFALPIDAAMTAVARRNPEKIVEGLLSRFGGGSDESTARRGWFGARDDGGPVG